MDKQHGSSTVLFALIVALGWLIAGSSDALAQNGRWAIGGGVDAAYGYP